MSAVLSLTIGVCLALSLASPAFGNEWKIDDTISALDGQRTYVAILHSTNTIRNSGGSDEPATLAIRCRGGYLDTYIAWPQALTMGAVTIQWKADTGNSTTEVWAVSADGSTAFSESSRAFLAKLRGAHRATFQASLANFDSLQANFNVTGVEAIIDTALAACPP